MSRCFPFPPPGYEKKIIITTDESDSLIKEKQKKEKKHKKDKEKKERKDKETSKDKHKERKEKKEKRKDKKDKDGDKEKSSSTSEDKKSASVLPNTGDTEQVVPNTLLSNGNGESKFVQDLARRIRDEEKATDSQSVGKISIPNGVTENNLRKVDEKRSNAMQKRPENAVLRVSSNTDQKGADVVVKPSEKKDHTKKTVLHEKNHRRESVTKSDLPLDSEGIKKNEQKHTSSQEEKTEEKKQIGHDKPKYVEGGPRLKERDVDFRVHDLSKASVKNLTANGVLGKRKDHETNGFLYENGSRPNKIQKPVASPITSSVENGRKLVGSQTLTRPVSELQGPVFSNPEVKEHRVNGFIDSQEHKNRPTTSSSSVRVKENGESSSKKRPHSDLKYLDLILNVPQREELSEVGENEEQEWLFGQSGVKLLKKPRTDSPTTSLDESLQVWNQALRIESADLVALPYVVPF